MLLLGTLSQVLGALLAAWLRTRPLPVWRWFGLRPRPLHSLSNSHRSLTLIPERLQGLFAKRTLLFLRAELLLLFLLLALQQFVPHLGSEAVFAGAALPLLLTFLPNTVDLLVGEVLTPALLFTLGAPTIEKG